MSWVHPATLRPDSPLHRESATLCDEKPQRNVRVQSEEDKEGEDCHPWWRRSKNPTRVLPSKLSIREMRDHKFERKHNTRSQVYTREQMQRGAR